MEVDKVIEAIKVILVYFFTINIDSFIMAYCNQYVDQIIKINFIQNFSLFVPD